VAFLARTDLPVGGRWFWPVHGVAKEARRKVSRR
jgi:hypothetical protein